MSGINFSRYTRRNNKSKCAPRLTMCQRRLNHTVTMVFRSRLLNWPISHIYYVVGWEMYAKTVSNVYNDCSTIRLYRPGHRAQNEDDGRRRCKTFGRNHIYIACIVAPNYSGDADRPTSELGITASFSMATPPRCCSMSELTGAPRYLHR